MSAAGPPPGQSAEAGEGTTVGSSETAQVVSGLRSKLAEKDELFELFKIELLETKNALVAAQESTGADAGRVAVDALLGTAAGAQVVMKKLASKIAVGVKEDLTLTNSYQPGGSRKDFDECLAYRHEDFLNERREKGGDMLQDFLAELFSAIEPKSVAAVGEDKAGREARSARLRATATATAYAYASKHFTWKFGVLQNVYLKCKTNSREVGDIAAAHTPGSPSYNTVVAMCKKIAAEWEEDFELDADTMLIDMIKPTQQSGATPKKNSKKRGKRG